MSNKVAQLARKLAIRSIFADNNEQFHQQRERLSQFSFDVVRKLGAIANEMEGDLFTLKHKGFPKNEWRELAKIYQEVVLLKKGYESMKPYESAQKIIDKINDKMFRSNIHVLDLAIQHFLKNNQVDTITGPTLGQARVDSLRLLVDLSKSLKTYMETHPLLDDPRAAITKPPPRPAVIEDPEFNKGTPGDVTNPGDKNRK